MSDTDIEWADKSWNMFRAYLADGGPKEGKAGWACSRVSPGCDNCYAAQLNRFRGTGLDYRKQDLRHVTIQLADALFEPLSWRKPKGVFPCSMTDLFLAEHSSDTIEDVFAIMALARRHTFRVLTKRPERAQAFLADRHLEARVMERADVYSERDRWSPHADWNWVWPLPNVWMGTSVEDQRRADERLPILRRTRAAKLWVSFEPLLEPVLIPLTGDVGRSIDWAVIGGESGPGARPFDVNWARFLITQLRAIGARPYVKQIGARPYDQGVPIPGKRSKGGEMDRWPEDIRVREFPDA